MNDKEMSEVKLEISQFPRYWRPLLVKVILKHGLGRFQSRRLFQILRYYRLTNDKVNLDLMAEAAKRQVHTVTVTLPASDARALESKVKDLIRQDDKAAERLERKFFRRLK